MEYDKPPLNLQYYRWLLHFQHIKRLIHLQYGK